MKLPKSTLLSFLALAMSSPVAVNSQFTGNMVKMCLFYGSPSGHARTDPILNNECASDHVHTFYGPQNFHPDTTHTNLLETSSQFSSTPFEENQSLYWHPSIYEVDTAADGTKTYTRVSNLETSPYYRWDNSVTPLTEAFPESFRMIAYSNQDGADEGGETGGNMFVECCNYDAQGNEDCTETVGELVFPRKNCSFVGLAFAMPTCWNGNLGIDNDHINHMAYTEDGSVAGACPQGYDRRVPQIQLFVRINNYRGATKEYTLSDESNVFHVDFMNGWKGNTLQNIITNCPVIRDGEPGYNPPCNCAEDFLTPNNQASGAVCDSDVRSLILDEPTDVVNSLPRGTCNSPSPIIQKSWTTDPPLTCSPPPPGEDDTPPPEDDTVADDDGGEECMDGEKFVLNATKKGKVIIRSCSWLKNQVPNKITNICRKRTKYGRKNGENYAPAQVTCAQTCQTCEECYENPKSRFILPSGKQKTCRWLSKIMNEDRKASLCENEGNNVWPGTYDICPQACEECE